MNLQQFLKKYRKAIKVLNVKRLPHTYKIRFRYKNNHGLFCPITLVAKMETGKDYGLAAWRGGDSIHLDYNTISDIIAGADCNNSRVEIREKLLKGL